MTGFSAGEAESAGQHLRFQGWAPLSCNVIIAPVDG